MKRHYLLYILLFIQLKVVAQLTTQNSISINFQSFAYMDVVPGGSIILTFTRPIEAGKPINNPILDNTKWIKYTSSLANGESNRRITASINEIIPGVNLKIQVENATTGGGIRGVPTSMVTLNTNSQNIITGIGGSFTGTLANQGHRINLSAEINSYNNLIYMLNRSVIITYTITE